MSLSMIIILFQHGLKVTVTDTRDQQSSMLTVIDTAHKSQRDQHSSKLTVIDTAQKGPRDQHSLMLTVTDTAQKGPRNKHSSMLTVTDTAQKGHPEEAQLGVHKAPGTSTAQC